MLVYHPGRLLTACSKMLRCKAPSIPRSEAYMVNTSQQACPVFDTGKTRATPFEDPALFAGRWAFFSNLSEHRVLPRIKKKPERQCKGLSHRSLPRGAPGI